MSCPAAAACVHLLSGGASVNPDADAKLWRSRRTNFVGNNPLTETDRALGAPERDAWTTVTNLDVPERPLWSCADDGWFDAFGVLNRAGLPIVALSNSDGFLERDLETHGMRSHFSAVLDSVVTGYVKPDPAAYRHAAAAAGTPWEQCVYIGDTPHEVVAAQAIGMAGILIDHGGWSDGDPRLAGTVWVASLTPAVAVVIGASALAPAGGMQ
ncbi:MAG: HAD family hydrolase [Acidimicrobiia bacterium]